MSTLIRRLRPGRWPALGIVTVALSIAVGLGFHARRAASTPPEPPGPMEAEIASPRPTLSAPEAAAEAAPEAGTAPAAAREARFRAHLEQFEPDLPAPLRPGRILRGELRTTADGRTERRSVVAAHPAGSLGELLLVESFGDAAARPARLYSAAHLIVSAADAATLSGIEARLRAAGFSTRHRLPTSRRLQVALRERSPGAIDAAFDAVQALAHPEGVTALDAVGSGGGGAGGATTPTDPDFGLQWHHQRIQSPQAWDLTTGSERVTVAVLDTGIDTTGSEFAGRLLPGHDFANDDDDPTDDHGHGTAVAGVIAANEGNGSFVAGVDWHCRILPIKVLDALNLGFYSWWAEGIDHAVAAGARVINLSAGGNDADTGLTTAIESAIREGRIFVTITHNDSSGTIRFPGRLAAAITVGATERDDRTTTFSNWGEAIDLVAPGRDIYTVSWINTLTWWWGTSFAAPQVAGAAALLLAVDPSLDQAAVAALLTAGAEDGVGDALDTVGFDPHYGWGRLNLYRSLVLARTAPVIQSTGAEPIRLTWTTPPQLGTRHPFGLRVSADLSAWTPLTDPDIEFPDDTTATWIDDGTATGTVPGTRFYEVTIAPRN